FLPESCYASAYLDMSLGRTDLGNRVNPGTVDIFVWIISQKIADSINA
ncbi:unnamed protein product, partial [marine sediment metagenome]